MSDYLVVLVDGARARHFSLEPVEITDMEGGPNLVELGDLINPEQDTANGELWTNNKSGRNRVRGSGQAHGYDDHREKHGEEIKRRFVRTIAQETAQFVDKLGSRNLVIAAEKRMLGYLRNEFDTQFKGGIQLRFIPKDLSKLSARAAHEYLAKENHLPGRKVVSV